MKLLEEKIRDLKAEGSKQTRSPENDPTPTEDAAHHQSEVTQQDGLGLGQEPVEVESAVLKLPFREDCGNGKDDREDVPPSRRLGKAPTK